MRPVRPASSTSRTGHPQARPKTFKPKRSEVDTWKVNESKVQEGVGKQKLTFDRLLNKYAKAVPKDQLLKKTPRSPLHQGKPTYPRREFSKRKRDVTTLFPPQKVYSTMPWMPPATDSSCPTWEHEGIWMQCYPMPHSPPHQRGGNFRRPVFDRLP